jgi:hypothetical protein
MLHALILARSSVEAKPHIKYKSAPPDLKRIAYFVSRSCILSNRLAFRYPAIMISNQKIIITSKRRGDMKPPFAKILTLFIKNYENFLQIYKIKIYKSISFSFSIIAEIQFTIIFINKQMQIIIKIPNKI